MTDNPFSKFRDEDPQEMLNTLVAGTGYDDLQDKVVTRYDRNAVSIAIKFQATLDGVRDEWLFVAFDQENGVGALLFNADRRWTKYTPKPKPPLTPRGRDLMRILSEALIGMKTDLWNATPVRYSESENGVVMSFTAEDEEGVAGEYVLSVVEVDGDEHAELHSTPWEWAAAPKKGE